MLKGDNLFRETSLHRASKFGHEKIVKLFLNVFKEAGNKKKLAIEFLKKENTFHETALHFATKNGYEEIVKLLLNAFGEFEHEELIDYVLKENKEKETSSQLASYNGHEIILHILSQKLAKATIQKKLYNKK